MQQRTTTDFKAITKRFILDNLRKKVLKDGYQLLHTITFDDDGDCDSIDDDEDIDDDNDNGDDDDVDDLRFPCLSYTLIGRIIAMCIWLDTCICK